MILKTKSWEKFEKKNYLPNRMMIKNPKSNLPFLAKFDSTLTKTLTGNG